jgi:hypothetical protein
MTPDAPYRYLLDPHRVAPADLQFRRDECHRAATGCCSLDPQAVQQPADGRARWDHCRRLAVLAHVWRMLRQHFDGHIPTDNQAACTRPAVIASLQDHWQCPYGRPEHWDRDTKQAISLYEGIHEIARDEPVVVSFDRWGNADVTDGRHRCCMALQLGLQLIAQAHGTDPAGDR